MNTPRPPNADLQGARSAAITASSMRGAALTVLDGHGGALALDLALDDLRWLAAACRRLPRGAVPLGACALKVRAAEKSYLVSRPSAQQPDAAWDVTIADRYDPGESVTLASELAGALASMIDEALLCREHALVPPARTRDIPAQRRSAALRHAQECPGLQIAV